jgi:hypothetical protein
MLADELDYVVGVDTHLDEHVARGGRRTDGRCGCATLGAGERTRLRASGSLRRSARARCSSLGG